MNGRRTSRRQFLRSGLGFGSIALAGLTARQVLSNTNVGRPLRYQPSHYVPKAKRVIMLYMEGGPSQIDMMDYKPKLEKIAGKTIGLREDKYQFQGALMPSKWKFQPSLKTGLHFSELLPNLSLVSDQLCLLNGMHTDSTSHTPATLMLHTGAFNVIRPSVGSWVVYGLGSENENLPAFININPVDHLGGTQNYSSAFLPASCQGTRIRTQDNAMPNLDEMNSRQRRYLDLLEADNQEYLARHEVNPEFEAMVHSFELAFRMQSTLPKIMDLGNEPAHIKKMYGITAMDRNKFSNQCLIARRLAEAGVRFIQLTQRGWDNHTDLAKSLPDRCRDIDQPIAGLILDLKQRGMLDDTLVVWGGEFGRSAAEQNSGAGRRHQSLGYTMFFAGGGVKGGIKHGATDETGSHAVQGKVHMHDLHATILHLMGIDHEALTYRYAGRDFRLTDVYGNIVHDIIA